MLKAAEDQIERKIAEMKSLQNTIQGLLRQYNDQEDNKMRSLVKIYENMKPKEAAKIFEQLDMPIMLEVIERMKEQKVAPILAEMDPAKARVVTSELAQRRSIPMPKPSAGG
jgi:flagellar motility protein MotE (MotC chaperone)